MTPDDTATFHIVNLGCKVNRVEADTFAAALLASGARMASEEDAGLILVNTCTVTGEADKKARKAVRHALSVNPCADVIVTGCAAAIAPDVFTSMDARVRVVSKEELLCACAEGRSLPLVARDPSTPPLRGSAQDDKGAAASAASVPRSERDQSCDAPARCEGDPFRDASAWCEGAAEFASSHVVPNEAGETVSPSVALAGDRAAVPPSVALAGDRAGASPSVILSGAPEGRGVEGSPHNNAALHPLRIGEGFRTRVGIKVQDGCDHACTYCIVHVARGPARSVDPAHILREARGYFEAGTKEIVLAGIDIGAYRHGDVRLSELVKMLLDLADSSCQPGERAARIRISSIEPMSIDDELVRLLATADGRLCRHLHIPLQSGSDKVLREMERPYTAGEFQTLIEKIRSAVPSIALSTDIIVGFPGETEEEFRQTCDLAEKAGFSRLHVFPYSRREGTPAALRADQVPPDVKRDRAARLRALGKQLSARDFALRAGVTELAIVEDDLVLTESYHELPVPPGAALGSLIPITL